MTTPPPNEDKPVRRPSRADVAARAIVSAQTVTRVVQGLPNVDPTTRANVLKAMRELGYRPNRAAQALRSGRFHNIGVVMFTLPFFGNMHTLAAISSSAAHAGYSITLIPVTAGIGGDVNGALTQLQAKEVDGIIMVIEAHIMAQSDVALPPGLPVVVIDSSERTIHPMVDSDQAEGARLATAHLLELGHQTVVHLAGPAISYAARSREHAWRDTLEAAGRPVPPIFRGDWSSQSGYEAGRLIAADPRITAVFASNDQMALGLLRALHEAGRRVPEDISVVGFDDMSESASFWPPLTTVHQDFNAVGKKSIEMLVSAIEGGPVEPVSSLVPTRLIIRNSSARPPV